MPFYLSSIPSANTPGCNADGSGFLCASQSTSAPFGKALNPSGTLTTLSRWATLYWVVAIGLGFALVLAYYRQRSLRVGVQGRVWPAITLGAGLLALVVFANRAGEPAVSDFWIRGTGALVIIAIGLLVLAVLERSRPFAAFTAGFFALALLSNLYDDINILARLGLGAVFQGSAEGLPNLLIPGIYLLLGGVGFLLGRRWTVEVHLARRSV
jgi:hypothetical protein